MKSFSIFGKLNITAFAILLLSFVTGYTQDNSNVRAGEAKFGVSTAIQSEQLDLMFPIWSDGSIVLVPSISFVYVSDAGTDFGFGVAIRHNIVVRNAVPYLGFRGGMLILNPDNGDSIRDFVYGLFGGGEYFLDKHFSVSVEAQINISKSDENSNRFGNPDGTNVNTATLALVSFYF